jgi:hydroxymethylpyrimidine/phosphomethylpyrimidine kinase
MNGARRVPHALSIAGVDPSGGAGILADIKTFSALGAYGCAVVAALTAQNTQGVAGVAPVPPDFVALQIDTLFADMRIDAVKTGMLGQQGVIAAVADRLAHWRPAHFVLDPVMVASSGDLLLEKPAIGILREALLPLATLLTPNLPEAGALLGERPGETGKDMRRAAERLREKMTHAGERWVLLKGGHLPDSEAAIDQLHDGDRMIELAAPRVDTRHTHGTGCMLSAALTALLPRSGGVPHAAQGAKAYLTEALRHGSRLEAGAGRGPAPHFPAGG